MPKVFGEPHIEDLTTALEFLKTEISSSKLDGESKLVREDDQSAYQVACRRLAQVIKRIYETADKPLPHSEELWINSH